jgi:hypothetical protein
LSENPNAIHLLEANPDNIEWALLSSNPGAIPLLEANPDKIDWLVLSGNPNAIPLLEANQDKIKWVTLSSNPNAIHLLEKNPKKIYWPSLSENPNAIHLIEQNLGKLDDECWGYLSENPCIFELDYEALTSRCCIYKEELMQIAMHPSRIEKYLDMGISIHELDNYI